MTQNEVFGKAKWIGADTGARVPLIRKSFLYKKGEPAILRVLGLGTFVCYINGKRVSDEYFLPLISKFDATNLPVDEELFGYRVYVSEYDISSYLSEGKNTLSVMIGEGIYTELRFYGIHRIFENKKLIFRLTVGNEEIVSDGSEKFIPSFILRSGFHEGGEHDYTDWNIDAMLPDFDEGGLDTVRLEKPLVDTEYCFSDCPTDKIIRTLKATPVYSTDSYKIYDCGINTTGYPIVTSAEGYKGEIKITYSEELSEDGTDIDENHVYGQHLYATVDGKPTDIYPYFSWFGFRYFRVEGAATCDEVKVIYADVDVNSSFKTNDETLNWIYDAFINTQLSNMHRGGPSDCPHYEREFYTGDGQLVARSAMMTLDGKKFYEKWIRDISDCQDKKSGRVQYTAPTVIDCGGGPGGWGCAITVVPYEYYKAYGDDKYIRELYPQMKHFLEFLEAHSESDLVTSYKEGRWCLGDWAGLKRWHLPAPFVNTYFRVLTTERVIEIAKIIGKDEDIPKLRADVAKCKAAINKFYYNDFSTDKSYCANTEGANAFAIAIGLGDINTRKNLAEYYDALGYYDTGIFGTELVTRVLFELGYAETAYKLLTASEPYGFGKWRLQGATTLREYFRDLSRSHSHPMFGAVVAVMYEYILGIRQKKDSAAYKEIIIAPAKIKNLTEVSGHITSPYGKIALSYVTENGERIYTVQIPDGVTAQVEIDGIEPLSLTGGTHTFKASVT